MIHGELEVKICIDYQNLLHRESLGMNTTQKPSRLQGIPTLGPSNDDIQGRLLKISAPAISERLCFLLNFSLTSGQAPSDWKRR